jgi:DNA mismatch repair ATPase MutS
MYEVQVAYAAEAWRIAHGAAVRSWLAATGEIEALLSLSGYSYEHPADPFPEFVEGPPCFNVEQIGHPLIPTAKCVRNEVSVCGETRALLISGSNMSGKSTLLRAVGVNVTLAQMGGPVCADALRLPPVRLATSMRISDPFRKAAPLYAEITRTRSATSPKRVPRSSAHELLRGTTERSPHRSRRVVRALLASGAIGPQHARSQ